MTFLICLPGSLALFLILHLQVQGGEGLRVHHRPCLHREGDPQNGDPHPLGPLVSPPTCSRLSIVITPPPPASTYGAPCRCTSFRGRARPGAWTPSRTHWPSTLWSSASGLQVIGTTLLAAKTYAGLHPAPCSIRALERARVANSKFSLVKVLST